MKSPLIEPLEARIAPAVISILPIDKAEGNTVDGMTEFKFSILLDAAADADVTVQATTIDGTALVSDGDYVANSGLITILQGATTAEFTVLVKQDTKREGNESFGVVLSNPSGTNTLSPTASAALGVIKNDDPNVNISIVNAVQLENAGGDSVTLYTFNVSLDVKTDQTVTVHAKTADGTAVGGADFTPIIDELITFAPGEDAKTIVVSVNNDGTYELSETFKVVLSDATHAGLGTAEATGTITNDDARPTLKITDQTITEGANGAKFMNFTVTRTGETEAPITFKFSTETVADGAKSDDPATAAIDTDSDFLGVNGQQVTMAAGEETKTIQVRIYGDTKVEDDETFKVKLSDATNADLEDAEAVGTITNDDHIYVSVGDAIVQEGDSGTVTATFVVTLSEASTEAITVFFSTVDDTAKSAPGSLADYLARTNHPVEFAPGQTAATVTVTVNGDRVFESESETFFAQLSAPAETGVEFLNGGKGTGTIAGSADTPPTISISGSRVVEGDADTKLLEYTITLSEFADKDVLVNVATRPGDSTADGSDYDEAFNHAVTVPAGQKTVTFQVPIFGDTVDEAEETLVLEIATAKVQNTAQTPLTVTGDPATGTIANNDLIVTLAQPESPAVFFPVTEGTEGGVTPFSIPIKLSGPLTHPLTLTFTVGGGTATSGSDYTPASTLTFTFAAGTTPEEMTAQVFSVVGDALSEQNETVEVKLVSAIGAQIGAAATTTVSITNDDAAPTLSIDDVTVTEGQTATFKISLSTISGQDVTVKWQPVIGTAGANDFALSGPVTVTIPAGSLSVNVTVQTTADAIAEGAETFTIGLSEPANATLADSVGTGTISANGSVSFSIGDATVVEGSSGTTLLKFIVTKQGQTDLPSSVKFSTSNGTANALSDYVAQTLGTLNFAPSETTKEISIVVNGDTLAETDETLFVTLSDATGGTISDATATGTIQSDESFYRIVLVEGSSFSVNEDASNSQVQTVKFRIERSGDLSLPGSVSYGTFDDDTLNAIKAITGVDYNAASGTVSFAASNNSAQPQLSNEISITIRKDDFREGNETFKLKLLNTANGEIAEQTGAGEQVITIVDNDTAVPKVKIEDAKMLEGNQLVFKVRLVAEDGTTAMAAGVPITVKYQTVNGTAIAADDYDAATGELVFAAGQTEKEIRITVKQDSVDETDETFQVAITEAKLGIPNSPEDLETTGAPATGTILNDDLIISVTSDQGALEGNAPGQRIFTISLSQVSTHDVTVKIKTKDGTAISTGDFADFTSTEQTVTILANQPSANFVVQVNGDVYFEPTETFTLELSDSTGAVISATTVSADILNDDAAPSLRIEDSTLVEGDNGTANLVFTVILTGASQSDITVDFSTIDGTAKSMGMLADFTAVSKTLTFTADGNRMQTVSVPILGDNWHEADETFTAKLSNAKVGGASSGISLGDAEATGTIIDDGDTVQGFTVRNAQVVEGASGGGVKLSFIVELTGPAASDVTFQAATRAGTAKAGSDFTALGIQTYTIEEGESSLTIEVDVAGDSLFEQSEYMFLDVSGVSSNAQVIGGSGTSAFAYGVILNDDIHVISTREFEYVDVNGDLVNVKFSKGSISVPTTTDSNGDFTFVRSGTLGGRYLQLINLDDDFNEFAGTNIIITARPQVLVTGEILGDGRANVGAIESATASDTLFQFTSGVNLGKVVVPGDLGRVVAGNIRTPSGIAELTVGSLGLLPDEASGSTASNDSVVLGPIKKMTVNGDVVGSLSVIGDAFSQPVPNGVKGVGRIDTLVIKGALRGGADGASGQISFTGGVSNATIGSIVGGEGNITGALLAVSPQFNTTIGKLTVLGDIVGGDGENSGYVSATHVGAVTLGKISTKSSDPGITGHLIGGAGKESGRIYSDTTIGTTTINGDIRGGAGESSGQVLATTTIGTTKLTGSLIGGSADSSGALVAGVVKGAVTIGGNILGGSAQNTGLLFIRGISQAFTFTPGSASSITIGTDGDGDTGDVIGGTAVGSGIIQVSGNLPKLTLYGDLRGSAVGETTAVSSTGGIVVEGNLGTAVLKGSLIGGNTGVSSTDTPVSVFRSGYIDAGNITKLTITGHVESGTNNGTSSTTLSRSGSISAIGKIGTLIVQGADGEDSLKGNEKSAVIISAGDNIGKATFNQDVTYAEILAGFTSATASLPRGILTNAGATIGTVTVEGTFTSSSIAAGADAGGDGRFGTLDDQAQSSTGTPGNLNLISRIASVILNSIGTGDDATGASFGIVAEQVDSVKVGGTKIPLTKGPHNDIGEGNNGILIGPADSKLKILEI